MLLNDLQVTAIDLNPPFHFASFTATLFLYQSNFWAFSVLCFALPFNDMPMEISSIYLPVL